MWKPVYLNVGFRLISPDRRGRWLCNELQKAGPVYVKLGQFISNRSDIFGQISMDLGSLRDQVKPVPYEKVRGMIERCEELVDVQEVPIASASISQIHVARLRRNGKKVVAKIKRPGIENEFKKDLDTIENFLKLTDKSLIDTVFRDFKESFVQETNFKNEIKNLKMFGDIYANSTVIKIPRVYPELSNDQLIVMDFVESVKPKRSDATRVMNMFLQQILFEGMVHGDLHAGNIGATRDNKIVMYDFGNIIMLQKDYQNMIREMIQAIQAKDQEKVLQIMKNMGMIVNDEKETREFIRGYLEYIDTVDVKSFSTMNFTSKIPVKFDRTTFQIIRTTGLVEGTCKSFDPEFTYQKSIILCIELLALGF